MLLNTKHIVLIKEMLKNNINLIAGKPNWKLTQTSQMDILYKKMTDALKDLEGGRYRNSDNEESIKDNPCNRILTNWPKNDAKLRPHRRNLYFSFDTEKFFRSNIHFHWIELFQVHILTKIL